MSGSRPRLGRVPEPFKRREGELLLFPLYQIFGSEELSASAPSIRERTPNDFVALHPLDAARLGVHPGDRVKVTTGGFTFDGSARLDLEVPEGCAGIFSRVRKVLASLQMPYGTVRRGEEKTWAA